MLTGSFMMQVTSPLSGEPITIPKRPVPVGQADLQALRDQVSQLHEKVCEMEERERSTVKELSGYAFRAMEAAMQARDHKPAPVPAADPQVAALRTVIDSMQSKLNEMCESMDEYRETESSKPPAPVAASVDMNAIANMIRQELAQAPKASGEMRVDVVDRDLNGHIKTFSITKGASK